MSKTFRPMLRRYLRATGVREFGESWIGVAGNRSPSPEVLEIHRLNSDSCAMSRWRVASMCHLEGLFERLGEHGKMNAHAVLSTEFEARLVQPPVVDARPVTRSAGWRS